jgi:hypothetical protein
MIPTVMVMALALAITEASSSTSSANARGRVGSASINDDGPRHSSQRSYRHSRDNEDSHIHTPRRPAASQL